MMEEDVLEELRRVKESIAAKYGYDVKKIAAAARRFAQQHPLPAPLLKHRPGSGLKQAGKDRRVPASFSRLTNKATKASANGLARTRKSKAVFGRSTKARR